MSEAAPDQSTDADGTSAEGGGGHPLRFRNIKRGDIALALGVIAILVVLLLPMPTWLLDFSLAISITFSTIILWQFARRTWNSTHFQRSTDATMLRSR